MLTIFFYPSTCLSQFIGHNISSYSYHPRISIIQYRLTDLLLSPTPLFLPWCGTLSTLPQSTLPLVYVPHAECLVLLTSPTSDWSPLYPVVHCWFLHIIFSPYISSPMVFSVSYHILVFGCWFNWLVLVQNKVSLAPPLPFSTSHHSLYSPANWPCWNGGSCFNWVYYFSIMKASMDLPWILWLYVMILHTPLGLYPESNWRLLTSSYFLSIHQETRIRKLHSFKCINMEYWEYLLNL